MSPPDLLDDGLRLRPWRTGEAHLFHRIWGDPCVIWWGADADLAATQARYAGLLARIAAMPPGLGWWAVEAVPGGALLGDVALQPALYDETVELGYHLCQAAWGRGVATRAAAAVLRHGFGTLDLPLVSGVVHVDNAPSHAVMARLGLQDTGAIEYSGMPHRRYAMTAAQARGQPWWRD